MLLMLIWWSWWVLQDFRIISICESVYLVRKNLNQVANTKIAQVAGITKPKYWCVMFVRYGNIPRNIETVNNAPIELNQNTALGDT